MAVPPSQLSTFSPQEIYFQSEDEPIEIVPRQNLDELSLIGITVPKLRALRREKLPLWLALLLKKQSRCSIVAPSWLEVNYLKRIYDEEVKDSGRFAPLPWHWLEISLALIEHANDDLESPGQIRTLVQDIREIRQAKARTGLSLLDAWHIQLDNLGLMEMNVLRPFMVLTMDRLRKIDVLVNDDEQDGETGTARETEEYLMDQSQSAAQVDIDESSEFPQDSVARDASTTYDANYDGYEDENEFMD